MTNRSMGQIAYDTYHHGQAGKQVERSTVAPLPYAALGAAWQAVWEEVGQAVLQAAAPNVNSRVPWVGFDLDGTLARYGDGDHDVIGRPVKPVLDYLRHLLDRGTCVKIVTARVAPCPDIFGNMVEQHDEREKIKQWCIKHVGRALDVTCCKDYGMITLIDDRSVQVEPNQGIRADGQPWYLSL